jgi:hypothetical protein
VQRFAAPGKTTPDTFALIDEAHAALIGAQIRVGQTAGERLDREFVQAVSYASFRVLVRKSK